MYTLCSNSFLNPKIRNIATMSIMKYVIIHYVYGTPLLLIALQPNNVVTLNPHKDQILSYGFFVAIIASRLSSKTIFLRTLKIRSNRFPKLFSDSFRLFQIFDIYTCNFALSSSRIEVYLARPSGSFFAAKDKFVCAAVALPTE